jgi:hypothetical protein
LCTQELYDEPRLAKLSRCPIDMEACIAAHHLSQSRMLRCWGMTPD